MARHGRTETIRRRNGSTKVIPTMITFTSGATEVATLSRGTTVYATGAAKSTRLSLYARRMLRPGHYELTLTGRTTTRRRITIR